MRKFGCGFMLALLLVGMIDNAEAGRRCRGQYGGPNPNPPLEGGISNGKPWGEGRIAARIGDAHRNTYQQTTATRGRFFTTVPGIIAD